MNAARVFRSVFRSIVPPRLGLLPLLLLGCFSAGAANPTLAPNVTTIVNPEKSGAELVERLRSAVPANSGFERSGRLEIITRDDKTTIVPFRSVVTKTATNWSIAYTARPGGDACESLVIEHITGRPNRYARSNCATGNGADSNAVKSVELLGADLVRPFGRSDFWICDLGLEFLDWPRQRVLSHEIRNSRSCWVLESSTSAPVPGGYARVISWVDVEQVGIIRAEAYETGNTNKPIKEFLVSSLRKVSGQREVESMKMRNLRSGQETELKFDPPKN